MKIVQDTFEEFIKLNFRCPKGKFVPDSFACGETPAEAKKNYKAYQKEKKQAQQDRKTTKGAVKSAKDAKKKIKKVSDPEMAGKVAQVKDLIAKVGLEKKSGKVSKETYKALKLAVNELKSKKSGSEQKAVPESKQVAQKVEKPNKIEKPSKVVNSDLAVDTMKSGEIWNAGLMGDIKVDEVDDENDTVTVTANNFTETMTKGALKKALREYNVTKKDVPLQEVKKRETETEKIKAMRNSHPELYDLRGKIIGSGGSEKFLEDADIPLLKQGQRAEMNMHSMKIQYDRESGVDEQFDYEVKPFKRFGDVSFHKMGPNKNDIAIVAGGKHFVGYVYGYGEEGESSGVDAVISDEFRGMGGLGKRALIEYFNMNPHKITDVGGLTPNGYKAYTKMLKSIETGDLPEDDIGDEEKEKIKDAVKYIDDNIDKGPIMGAKMLEDKTDVVKIDKKTYKKGDLLGYDRSNPQYIINGVDKENVYITSSTSGIIGTVSIKDFNSRIKNAWFGKHLGNIDSEPDEKQIKKKQGKR